MSESDSPARHHSHLLVPGWDIAQIDTSVAHTARMYNYYLGGKDNYEVDREAAEQALTAFPQLREMARANRAFLGRAVRYLAGQGIRQFLDIGTGIPGPGNTNEVAHTVAPDARVVYVDNDPIVMAHASALLAGHDPGHTTVVYGDLRDPQSVLDDTRVRAVLDFEQPIAVMLLAVVQFIRDSENPTGVVNRLMQATAPGSYLVLSHPTAEGRESESAEEAARTYDRASATVTLRSKAQITAFFNGLDLVEPGVVQQPWWQPDGEVLADPHENWGYGGIARKSPR